MALAALNFWFCKERQLYSTAVLSITKLELGVSSMRCFIKVSAYPCRVIGTEKKDLVKYVI